MNINKLKIEISKLKFLNKPLRILYNKIFLKYFYNFLNNLKIKKIFYTTTGKYYLPLFAWEDIICNDIKNNKIYRNEIYEIGKKYIRDNSIILDIGSSYGQFSVLFSKLKNNTQVYSFEAQKFIFELLLKNCSMNSSNIKCFYNYVGNEIKTFKVKKDKLDKYLTWGSNNIEFANSTKDFNVIEGIKIDNIKFNKKVSFMKVITQGKDLDVLKGAKQTIIQNKMPIVFEYDFRFEKINNYKFYDFEMLINEINYKIESKIKNAILILPK